MKVAFVVEQYHRRGGHERVVAELAERLLAHHEVHVLARDWSDVRRRGIIFHRVRAATRPSFLAYAHFTAQSTLAALHGDYDVVHSQGPNCLVPNVVTVHTTQRPKTAVLRSLPLFWHGLTPASKVTWQLHQRFAICAETLLYRRGSRRLIIALSQGIRAELVRDYGTDPFRIVVIPNGVDLQEFHPRNSQRWRLHMRKEIGVGEGDFVCLFVGGEWERKGLDVAIQSLAFLKDSRPRLLVVGKGRIDTFAAMAREFGVAERVVFGGFRSSTAPLYAAADALIMPSRYEAFSLVMLEAAASGIPIVATRVNGVEDFLEDGRNGLIVEETPRAVAAAIDRLIHERGLKQRMGTHARRRAAAFGWERVSAEIDRLYCERVGP